MIAAGVATVVVVAVLVSVVLLAGSGLRAYVERTDDRLADLED